VLPPEDMPAFTGTDFHRNIRATKSGKPPTTIEKSVLSLREGHRRRTRLPLKTLTVAHPDAAMLKRYGAIIAEFVNVKTVLFTAEVADFGSRDIKVNSKLGAKLGVKFKEVLAAQRARAWIMRTDGHVEIAGIVLEPHDFELRLQMRQGPVAEPFDSWRGVVALDTEIYPELQAEGWARDFVRLVQTTRKQAAYSVTDRIRIAASVSPELAHAFTEFNSYVKRPSVTLFSRQGRYRITSSAPARIALGTVTPAAFAASRFMISSNLVGCSTGNSSGLAPFSILST
jgi:Domain of unknown function (DUF5915)